MQLKCNVNFQLQGINLTVYSSTLYTVETALLWVNAIFIYCELWEITAIFLYGSFEKLSWILGKALITWPSACMCIACLCTANRAAAGLSWKSDVSQVFKTSEARGAGFSVPSWRTATGPPRAGSSARPSPGHSCISYVWRLKGAVMYQPTCCSLKKTSFRRMPGNQFGCTVGPEGTNLWCVHLGVSTSVPLW